MVTSSFLFVLQGYNYGKFKGAPGLKLQFYGNDKTMNMNPLILANVQGSPYFKVILNMCSKLLTFDFRMNSLRWELFTRLLMRFITKWIIWSHGLLVPGKQRVEVQQECVVEWEVSLLEELCPLHSVSFTSFTHLS